MPMNTNLVKRDIPCKLCLTYAACMNKDTIKCKELYNWIKIKHDPLVGASDPNYVLPGGVIVYLRKLEYDPEHKVEMFVPNEIKRGPLAIIVKNEKKYDPL
jgi:hypothetical protein